MSTALKIDKLISLNKEQLVLEKTFLIEQLLINNNVLNKLHEIINKINLFLVTNYKEKMNKFFC